MKDRKIGVQISWSWPARKTYLAHVHTQHCRARLLPGRMILLAGIPSRYVTSQLGQLSLASLRGRLIEYQLLVYTCYLLTYLLSQT